MATNIPEIDPEIIEYLESVPQASQAELDEVSLEDIINEYCGQEVGEEMDVDDSCNNESVKDVLSELESELAAAQLV